MECSTISKDRVMTIIMAVISIMYLNHSPTLIQWRFGTRVKLDHLYTYPCLNTYTLKQSYAHVGLTTCTESHYSEMSDGCFSDWYA